MSKRWYSRPEEIMMKDGTSKKEYKYVFETDNLQMGYFIEFMFRCLMDYKSEPERHGQWIPHNENAPMFSPSYCSECGAICRNVLDKFCYQCGTKMDGESE